MARIPRIPRIPRVVSAAVALLAASLVVGPLGTTAGADTGPGFATPEAATITPGIQTFTDGAQCTANFVFSDGTEVYIGQAAHCSSLGAANETDGCLAESLPADGTTKVELGDSGVVGDLVYSSWETMQAVGETDTSTCRYNDFALIRVPAEAVSQVNPSIPHWGGPVGVNTTGTSFGETIYSYGNSSLRLGLTVLSPKEGTSLGTTGDGWTHPVYTATPGIPGDSGSAMLDSQGRAAGVLSTVALAPLTGSNNFSDVGLALSYMQTHASGFADVQLVEGDVAFDGGALPLGV